MKIAALHQGGDWSDASANYVVIPEGVDVHAQCKAWSQAMKVRESPWIDLDEWLLRIPGVRKPTKDELEVYDFT